MKTIQKAKMREEGIRHVVYHEKEVMQKLDCPFAAKFYYSFQTDAKLYFILEYISGGEFSNYLSKKGRLSNEIAKFYAAEILLAIEYLHERDIIYRDLKTHNIMLDEKGHIKLIDFGLAKILENGHAGTICGTPNYVAPEVLINKSYTKLIDFWSLGIVIYEMLSGYTPFYGDNPQKVLTEIVNCKVVMKPYFSAEAKDLLRKLLCKDPTQRLGAKYGANEIKKHPFFEGIDWNKLELKTIISPIQENENSITKTPPAQSPTAKLEESPYVKHDECFDEYENFTYVKSPAVPESVNSTNVDIPEGSAQKLLF